MCDDPLPKGVCSTCHILDEISCFVRFSDLRLLRNKTGRVDKGQGANRICGTHGKMLSLALSGARVSQAMIDT